jgi:hypothetical protein
LKLRSPDEHTDPTETVWVAAGPLDVSLAVELELLAANAELSKAVASTVATFNNIMNSGYRDVGCRRIERKKVDYG